MNWLGVRALSVRAKKKKKKKRSREGLCDNKDGGQCGMETEALRVKVRDGPGDSEHRL